MVSLRRTLAFVFAAGAALLAGSAGAGEPARPVVVELFTSQGCSSCPPADALLGRLSHRPGVIALTLPITYWDMLGWKDTLANEGFTRRQKAYAAAMGHGGVYTPQVIVDGALDVVGSRVGNVEAAIAQRRMLISAATRLSAEAQRGAPLAQEMAVDNAPPQHLDPIVPVSLVQSPQEMRIDIGSVPGVRNATVWLFHLRSEVTVNVGAGENQGRALTYHNVVGDLRSIGLYKGRPLSIALPRSSFAGIPHDGIAVVVQEAGYGHVIGAAFVSRPDYYASQ